MQTNIYPENISEVDGQRLSNADARLWSEIMDFIQETEMPTKSAIRNGVKGKSARIDDSLLGLEDLGYIGFCKVGTSNVYRILKPLLLETVQRN